jgi:catechol 2,3-dioxygenase-like lactoylglutathione lyase family enzyme
MTIPVPEPKIFGTSRDPSYPAPAELLHVSLYHNGTNVDGLIRFYGVLLNMRLVYKYVYPTFEFIALSYDDENHRIGIVNSLVKHDALADAQEVEAGKDVLDSNGEVQRENPNRPRIEHTSWLYHRFEDVLMAAKRTHEELGLWPRTARHQGDGITIDYLDPDGNRVELLSHASSKGEILWRLEKMLGPKGGVEVRSYRDTYKSFNMEKMIALYESGYPLDQLKDVEHCQGLMAEGKL